jgi:hypothetical protein
VKVDPATGLRFIDRDKMTKILGGIVADQQRQLDEQRVSLAGVASQRAALDRRTAR